MDMKGEYRVEAPRDKVWAALNDPDVLKACIPGCEEIEKTSPTSFTAKVTAAVGPVKARFTGEVTLSDLNPPESYTISGEGKGGAAGFAKGGAKVHLTEDGPSATMLRYEVNASVGGKLAQLGGRLIDGTAKRMADQFFRCFGERVGAAPAVEAAAAAPGPAPAPPPPEPQVPPAAQVAVEPGAAFPPSQPSAQSAVEAAVGGPGKGMPRPAATTPRARNGRGADDSKPPAAGISPATWIIGLIVILAALLFLIL